MVVQAKYFGVSSIEESRIRRNLWSILERNYEMETIKKKYIVDEKNRKTAVLIDIRTFRKIEEILEDYALAQLIKENEREEVLDIKQAREYYRELDKSN